MKSSLFPNWVAPWRQLPKAGAKPKTGPGGDRKKKGGKDAPVEDLEDDATADASSLFDRFFLRDCVRGTDEWANIQPVVRAGFAVADDQFRRLAERVGDAEHACARSGHGGVDSRVLLAQRAMGDDVPVEI